MDDPPIHGDAGPIVEQVARDLIHRFGPAAAHYAREQAEIAADQGAARSAETWRDIAEAIDRLL